MDMLRRMRERFADPDRWTQGAFARDANGNDSVATDESVSTCWCLLGATLADRQDENDAFFARDWLWEANFIPW